MEGSLLTLDAVRPVAFFAGNAQTFSERWARRGGLALLALVRPLLYATHRAFATRVLYTLLRGVSQDRLDLLGEEYFQYVLQPQLKPRGVEKLKELLAADPSVVLVSQGLDHIMRPLASYLGVERLMANRLEFRDGLATGRLLDPVIRPRGGLARLRQRSADGRVARDHLLRDLGFTNRPDIFAAAIVPAQRRVGKKVCSLVRFDSRPRLPQLSVREGLAGKQVLLIGVTGFIGKVWLTTLLENLPEIGKIYLLIRRQRSTSALRRFEKIVEESPVFERFHKRYGDALAGFLGERIEVVEGDVTRPGLGLEADVRVRLSRGLDLVVNSSGLTEFNPDLREALATNVDATAHILDFVRGCDHAALLHLSTCYVAGAREGRVPEEACAHYTPARVAGFDALREGRALDEQVKQAVARSESPEVTEELRRQALNKSSRAKYLDEATLESHLPRYRSRWLRNYLTEAGTRRAHELGWPNTYTFTKSLAESLLQTLGTDLRVAIVRPSIVETSIDKPFRGWNEGVNTSAPLSYLLGTYFRQLPTNERKCLDLIPVDLVCQGMTLVAAALVKRCHERVYQLATSAENPCDMRRSIELTALAHRKYYRAQEGLENWLRSRLDAIPVSKARYQRLSAPAQKAVVQAINRTVSPFLFKRPPLARTERELVRVEKLIEIYLPFILHNEHVFEADNVEFLSQALPPEEQQAFGYDAGAVDWWEYWINIHVPALRKWVYPLIEGRPPESRPRRSFQLPTSAPADAADPSLAPEATWPSS